MDQLKNLIMRGRYKYSPLPLSSGDAASSTLQGQRQRPPRLAGVWQHRHRPWLKFTMVGASLAIVLYIFAIFIRVSIAMGGGTRHESCDSVSAGYQCQPSISHKWGQYSPFFSVPSEIDSSVPAGCEITFVQVLSRHGARDPTALKSLAYKLTVDRIHADVRQYGPGYEFIRDYAYSLGMDQLTLFGQREMINSGINFYERYHSLARDNIPFCRASGQERVIESGLNWTQGLHQARLADSGKDGNNGGGGEFPYSLVIIPETEGFNNSLSHSRCTAFEDSKDGHLAQEEFKATFLDPITARLNTNLPGANLTADETIYIMELCPFVTVSDELGHVSKYCGLFDELEWASYDYLQSLGKYYGYGDGNPFGATQGAGFVNELVARLTNTPVSDHTSTNSTLDSDPATFPLGRAIYADFSHDNDMAGVFAALGLYNTSGATPPDHLLPKTDRRTPADVAGYAASWTVPFAARMYVEKMTCGDTKDLVRILVNDRVIPLQNCGADALGRCGLDRFVDSLGFVRSGGYWDKCFEQRSADDASSSAATATPRPTPTTRTSSSAGLQPGALAQLWTLWLAAPLLWLLLLDTIF